MVEGKLDCFTMVFLAGLFLIRSKNSCLAPLKGVEKNRQVLERREKLQDYLFFGLHQCKLLRSYSKEKC
jgi:hypothetical protein